MAEQSFAEACLRYGMTEDFFRLFGELARIPRKSGSEKAVSDWCAAFARDHGLRHVQDGMHNIVIYKEGTPGREDHPPVILQGHLDMVCDHEPGARDPAAWGVDVHTDGRWLRGEGTTLGADNGIAVAFCLSILAAQDIPHPPLEVLLTVSEEIGLLGAAGIDPSLLKGRTLINLDSEEEGILTAGCAGGSRLDMEVPFVREPAQGTLCRITAEGLQGGHSGVLIHTGRGNALKILGRVLAQLEKEVPVQLVSMEGGKMDNAIPRKGTAEILVPAGCAAAAGDAVRRVEAALKQELARTDPDVTLSFEELGTETVQALPRKLSSDFTAWLDAIPNGVQSWVTSLPDMPETSLNLGVIRTREDALELHISTRSCVRGACTELTDRLQKMAEPLHARSVTGGSYPPWEYTPDTPLQKLCASVYREQTGKELQIEVIHAGLECGILCDRLPGLDAVSFGPDLEDVHTVRERMDVSSARRTWKFLLGILARL